MQNKGSLVLELQQRSIEFNSILEKHQNIKCVAKSSFCVHRSSAVSHNYSILSISRLMNQFMQVRTGGKDACLG